MEDIMEVSESKIRMTTAQSISKEKITRKRYLDSTLSSIQANRKKSIKIVHILFKESLKDLMPHLLRMGKLELERLIQCLGVRD
jgi:hypothetical protein